MSVVVDTSDTLWVGGALQGGNLCVLENGSERNGDLGFDPVPTETATEGRSGDGESKRVNGR